MAVPPKFQGHALRFPSATSTSGSSSGSQASHTLEIYLDYVCPYSAKLFNTLYKTILPALHSGSLQLSSPLTIILRQQVQPWHPSSTLTHEAALAVLRLLSTATNSKSQSQLSPEEISSKFYEFSAALFSQQKSFFDVNVVHESRNETYRRLAKVASEALEDILGEEEEEVYSLLEIPDKPAEDGSLNVGNAVTNDLKLLVKMARLVGVHVSPTVVFDGVVAGEISSSWTGEEWRVWLGRNVV